MDILQSGISTNFFLKNLNSTHYLFGDMVFLRIFSMNCPFYEIGKTKRRAPGFTRHIGLADRSDAKSRCQQF